MTEEDEEFNRIEREAAMRKEAVVSAVNRERHEYERGFVDGMQEQMKRSVDKAVNAMAQRPWVGLTLEDKQEFLAQDFGGSRTDAMDWAERKLKEKNT